MSNGAYDDPIDNSVGEDLEYAQFKVMIDAYFRKDYQDGCDYRLPHFTSYGVFKNLYYEELY